MTSGHFPSAAVVGATSKSGALTNRTGLEIQGVTPSTSLCSFTSSTFAGIFPPEDLASHELDDNPEADASPPKGSRFSNCCALTSSTLKGAYDVVAADTSQDELVPDAQLGEISASKKLFFDIAEIWVIWAWAAIYVSAELTCVHLRGESLVGLASRGVVASLSSPTGGKQQWWHLLSRALLLCLGFVQVLGQTIRLRFPVVHRFSGRAFVLLWTFVVGPTAVYLALFAAPGPTLLGQIGMVGFTIVSLDSAVWASYFFLRSFSVARRRERGTKSLVLHGQTAVVGIFIVMAFLAQRPFQLGMIAGRETILYVAGVLPASMHGMPRWLLETFAVVLLDDHVLLAGTTWIVGLPLLILADGPRAQLVIQMLRMSEEDMADFYGSARPTRLEFLFWRFRVPIYFILRCIATQARLIWSADADVIHWVP